MKARILFLALALAVASALTGCDKEEVIGVENLPAEAGQFINEYFPDATIATVIRDKDGSKKSYDVYFTNGNKIEFNGSGNWTDIECPASQVPERILPEKMVAYITANHDGNYAIEIDRDWRDYEVKLNNGVELIFDMDSNFIRYDY